MKLKFETPTHTLNRLPKILVQDSETPAKHTAPALNRACYLFLQSRAEYQPQKRLYSMQSPQLYCLVSYKESYKES